MSFLCWQQNCDRLQGSEAVKIFYYRTGQDHSQKNFRNLLQTSARTDPCHQTGQDHCVVTVCWHPRPLETVSKRSFGPISVLASYFNALKYNSMDVYPVVFTARVEILSRLGLESKSSFWVNFYYGISILLITLRPRANRHRRHL